MQLSESIKQTLTALLNLSDVDRNLDRLKRRCQECPALLDKNQRELDEENSVVKEKQDSVKEFEKNIRQMEMELKSRESEIQKYSQQLLVVKTNQEYTALEDQIKRLNEEKGTIETQILEAFDSLEELSAELKKVQAEQDERVKEFTAIKEELEKDLAAYRSESDKLEAARDEVTYEIDPDALMAYERVRQARDGEGIVPAESLICGGCYMAISNNDYQRIYLMNEIILCRSCQRILYLPELFS